MMPWLAWLLTVVLVACIADWIQRPDDEVQRVFDARRNHARLMSGRDA